MTLSFYTWSEFEKNCGYSRLYGGVNFPDSVANIKEMAIQMGRRAIDFVRYHVNLARGKYNSDEDMIAKKQQQSYYMYTRDRSQNPRVKRQSSMK